MYFCSAVLWYLLSWSFSVVRLKYIRKNCNHLKMLCLDRREEGLEVPQYLISGTQTLITHLRDWTTVRLRILNCCPSRSVGFSKNFRCYIPLNPAAFCWHLDSALRLVAEWVVVFEVALLSSYDLKIGGSIRLPME